jgi:hypothetical protein
MRGARQVKQPFEKHSSFAFFALVLVRLFVLCCLFSLGFCDFPSVRECFLFYACLFPFFVSLPPFSRGPLSC